MKRHPRETPIWANFLRITLIFLAAAASSQEQLPLPIETRFGTLEGGNIVQCNRHGDVCGDLRTILLNGEVIFTNELGSYASIVHYVEQDSEKDLLLFMIEEHRNTRFRFVSLSEDGVSYTNTFGRHGYAPKDFETSDDQISFRLERDYPANIDHWHVNYDGTTVTIETIYEDDTDFETAGGGTDVTRWQGASLRDLWNDGTERNRFRQILTDGVLNCIRTSTSDISAPFERKDGFLVSDGMWPSQGGSRHGYIAIEIQTGRPFAALMWGDSIYYFGAVVDHFPENLRSWIQQDVRRINAKAREVLRGRLSGLDDNFAELCS